MTKTVKVPYDVHRQLVERARWGQTLGEVIRGLLLQEGKGSKKK